jgi:putative nucleotidyltransferase with HDIG domain
LVVDDEPAVLEVIRLALEQKGWTCDCVADAASAVEHARGRAYRLVIADVCLPGMSGLDLLSRLRAANANLRVILISGRTQTHQVASALSLGAHDFLHKPFGAWELQSAVMQALEQRAVGPLAMRAATALRIEPQLRSAALESIWALVQAVEAKDPFTRRHSEQVARYAVCLAQELSLPAEEVESIRVGALLHDIGKIGVPDGVLTKPGPLTAEEFAYIRRHPVLGHEILQKITAFASESRLVRHHHEQWDGGGYPDGLRGTDIPHAARIINIADSVEAMLMKRTYKEAYPVERVVDELRRGAGKQFDPELAGVAAQWCASRPAELVAPAERREEAA